MSDADAGTPLPPEPMTADAGDAVDALGTGGDNVSGEAEAPARPRRRGWWSFGG